MFSFTYTLFPYIHLLKTHTNIEFNHMTRILQYFDAFSSSQDLWSRAYSLNMWSNAYNFLLPTPSKSHNQPPLIFTQSYTCTIHIDSFVEPHHISIHTHTLRQNPELLPKGRLCTDSENTFTVGRPGLSVWAQTNAFRKSKAARWPKNPLPLQSPNLSLYFLVSLFLSH